MRPIIVFLLLTLAGCLATQPPHDPTKAPKTVAPTPAPEPAASSELPAPELPTFEIPESKVELMKKLFLTQLDINRAVLKMAEEISAAELAELNRWMQDYGVQIGPTSPAPKPKPAPKPRKKSRRAV